MKAGKVYLVGAGPGDPALITQKGLECLARAEVVVYDRLADERCLEAAPPYAERVYVGKAASEHTLEQAEINRLLVQKAGEGKTVVRLKGGDPFVFGRGGEEADALAGVGIAFEVVPGVSSAVAVPAYAGIPVTHRGVASSFAVVTGHEDPAKGSTSINWEKLATGVDTLVFLMGMQNLAEIVGKLVEHGRSPATPVAVIRDGTRPEQKTVVGTLGDIVTKVFAERLSPPAVIVVGEVVRLREKLRWFDGRPLSGKRILVTRAQQQAGALSRLLAERGACALELPAIEVLPADDDVEMERAIKGLARYQWVVFTSGNGVAAFFERLRALRLDSRALAGARVAVIGPATAQALEGRGITADLCPEVFTSEALLAALAGLDVAGQRFLLPRADIADEGLSRGIERLGGKVDEVVAYRTVSADGTGERLRELLAQGGVDVVTFTSSSTVTNLMRALNDSGATLDGAAVACIGPKTAEAAARAGLTVDVVAAEHTIPGLVAALEDFFSKEA